MKNFIFDLTGLWNLKSKSGTYEASMQIPGDTHSALLAAGQIEDPYWADNEWDVHALGREDWILSREFEVDEALLDYEFIELSCEGVDTFASISVNGILLGETDNMFQRQRFDVRPLLRKGANQISLAIESAEKVSKRLHDALTLPAPTGPTPPTDSPYWNLVRKVQCHSGWDWGINLMVSGIYESIQLEAFSFARLDYVYTDQWHKDKSCDIEITSEIISSKNHSTEVSFVFDGQEQSVSTELQKGRNLVKARFTVENPKLWWPVTHGDQPLYDYSVKVFGEEVERRVGLRTIECISEDDEIGRSFLFRVNGRDLFMKGANWIPVDAMPSRHTRETYEDLLQSSVDANMNMIRVWGGGHYEKSDFYEICDEKGLLVWQDFMFACAMYPGSKDFMESVDVEVRHQIRRLRHHTSIALWCGNNECLGAFMWFKETKENRDPYLVNYDRLYEGVIGKAVDELDPGRTYWPSSPSAGRSDYTESWHDDTRGDMHYWQVWHSGASFDAYWDVVPRFCSEFGFQSFPSMPVIKTFLPEDQYNVTAPVMEHHQRNRKGNSLIVEMFSRYFRMPATFEDFVYLSQVQQGIAIKIAVEHWRHLRPVCMGTLYWQLNDCWPVSSWASVNYGGSWKYLHYMAKRFYAPTIVTAFQNKEEAIEVWVTNDDFASKELEATLQVISFEGEVLRSERVAVTAEGGAATLVKATPLKEMIEDVRDGFLSLSISGDDADTYDQNEHFFTEYKRCRLAEATVGMNVEEGEAGAFQVTLSTDKPVFYLSVESGDVEGRFSDNCFTLLPGEDRVLEFVPSKSKGADLDTLRAAISFKHLRSLY